MPERPSEPNAYVKQWQDSKQDDESKRPDFYAEAIRCSKTDSPARSLAALCLVESRFRSKVKGEQLNWTEMAAALKWEDKFDLLYARLLWTYWAYRDGWSSNSKKDEEAPPSIEDFLKPLKKTDDPHHNYRNWFEDYLFLAWEANCPETNSDVSDEPVIPTEFRELISVKHIRDNLSHIFGRRHDMYAIDHDFVNRKLTAQLTEKTLGPHLQIIQKLGEGGEGVVLLAENKSVAEQRALKLPKPVNSDQPFPNVLRLLDEGRTARELMREKKGIDIVEVFTNNGPVFPERLIDECEQVARIRFWLVENPIYIEMKYYPEGSLFDEVQRYEKNSSKLEYSDSAKFASQIALTLTRMHQIQQYHRDLKLENCMLQDGTLLLSDFGLSRKYHALRLDQTRFGTLTYMAPEQLSQSGNTTESPDVWALGVVLYRLLTGKMPFQGGSDLAAKIQLADYPKPHSVRNDIPEPLVEIIGRCLTKDPSRRPTANEVHRLLVDWLEQIGQSVVIKKYAWNPVLIQTFTKKRLTFLLLGLRPSGKDAFSKIEELMAQHRCTIYRIYRILGKFDVLIRAFIQREDLEKLVAIVRDPENYPTVVSEIEIASVAQCHSHWYWTDEKHQLTILKSENGSMRLMEHDTAAIERQLSIEKWETQEDMLVAIDKGIIRPIQENDDSIIFFVLIRETRHATNRKQIIDTSRTVLAEYSKELPEIRNQALYEIEAGSIIAIVKAEVTDFFEIGRLVGQLNSRLSAGGCMTMTCVAADKFVLGQEDLQSRLLSLRPTTEMLKSEFPSVYDLWVRQNRAFDDPHEEQIVEPIRIMTDTIAAKPVWYYQTAKGFISRLLELKIKGKPLIDIATQLLHKISIAADEMLPELIPGESAKSTNEEKLCQLASALERLCVDFNKSDYAKRIPREFTELKEITSVADLHSPKLERAKSTAFLNHLIELDFKIWSLDAAYRALRGGRPSSFASINDGLN